jgi:hypothetical protein
MVALDDVPAVIVPARVARALMVDLLPAGLADVADEEIAVLPVEAEAPRIAKAVGPDLVARRGVAVDEGVRRGDQRRTVHVEAQDLPQERARALRVTFGISGRAAAVAGGSVEVAVGTEGEHAAVVVRGGVVDRAKDLDRAGIGDVRRGGGVVFRDRQVAVRRRVEDEEAPVGLV